VAFKWNPPQGGQQPSLEDSLEEIRQKFREFRGGSSIKTFIIALFLGFAAWTSWFTVQPEETGVVQRFGKVMRTAGPGLHFKLPFGIETAAMVPTARVLKEEFGFRTAAVTPGQRTRYVEDRSYEGESLMLTGDLNVIDVQWIVQYRIQDPIAYLFKVRDTRKTIRDVTEAIMRRAVGNRLGSTVLTTARVEIARGREEITRTILTEARKIIPQYGIELVDVRIKRLEYVESVRKKVYERMISERKRIAAQFRSEGEGRSAEILGEMERELRQIRSMAYRKVQEIRGQGDAEATRIYGQAYNRDPEFYSFLRTLESYKEGAKSNSLLVLTTDSDFYRYLKDASPE
jgi:regulator of protease activity HflC (stomatin/prohibitin superfamily)